MSRLSEIATSPPRSLSVALSWFQGGSLGCVLIGPDGRIISVTRPFADMLGSPARLLFGQNILNVLTPTDRNGRNPLMEGVTSCITRNGRPLYWTLFKIARGAALAGYFVGLLCDETELPELHRQSLNPEPSMLGASAAEVAHEIAGPINLIANNAELLLADTGISQETRDSLELVRDEAFRLGNLLRDFLGMAGNPALNIAAEDVIRLTEKAVQLIKHQGINKELNFRIQADDNLPPVSGDAQRLLQVLLNLLKNACDASPDGADIAISLSCGKLQNDQPAVKILITDQGPGIDRGNLQKVFEPFFTTKPRGKGAGLGLAIARRMVEEHHGDLRLTSHPGKGTEAMVLLPVFFDDKPSRQSTNARRNLSPRLATSISAAVKNPDNTNHREE